MFIHGLQKLTLLDYPGKTACTIFLGSCNFRCPYCHNADLVLHPDQAVLIPEHELLAFLKKRRGLLDGVCVTGGEPLLHADLAPLLSSIRSLGFAVKLDTNGSFPERLKELVRLGLLDYVAMDIKNAPSKYPPTVGCPGVRLDSIQESVRFLLSGAVDYEFRTTMVKEFHTEEDFRSIGRWIAGARRYFLQGFVDSGHLVGFRESAHETSSAPSPHADPGALHKALFHGFTRQEALRIQEYLLPSIPAVQLRGYDI